MTSLQWLDSFPGFSDLSDDIKNAYIGLTSCLDTTQFSCADTNYLKALYAAHLYSVSNSAGASASGGPIASISEGDISISYGSVAVGSASDLNRSGYGSTLKMFIKNSITGMRLV